VDPTWTSCPSSEGLSACMKEGVKCLNFFFFFFFICFSLLLLLFYLGCLFLSGTTVLKFFLKLSTYSVPTHPGLRPLDDAI